MTATLLHGDCRDVLPTLPAGSVQTVVTSPPYFGLRDYGVEGQIGLELTPSEFVAALVDVFREVRRVLRDDGSVWLNLGDSYAGSWGAQSRRETPSTISRNQIRNHPKRASRTGTIREAGLKPKDLIGIPWRVAFALQDDGWWLRSDVIWHKPNCMPESVVDRPTRSHEYLFLLTKRDTYYYDAAAIAEPIQQDARPQRGRAIELAREKGLTEAHLDAIRACGIADTGKALTTTNGAGRNTEEMQRLAAEAKVALGGYYREFLIQDMRNRRTVWTIPTAGYRGAHFATFPEALVEPCIRAGSRPGDMVLDPFAGSGTTLRVAERLGRDAIGIELNPEYIALQERRLDGVQTEIPL